MVEFEIISLQPIRARKLWKAEIAVSSPDTIEGVEVGQNAKLTVRFSYEETGSVDGLLEAALEAARKSLSMAVEKLDGRTAQELRDAEQARADEIQRRFENPWADDAEE